MRVSLRFLLISLVTITLGRGRALAEPDPAADNAKPADQAPTVQPPTTSAEEAPPDQTPAAPHHSMFWKVSLGASAVVAVSGAAFTFYSNSRMNKEADRIHPDPSSGRLFVSVSSDDCGKTDAELGLILTDRAAFDRACTWHTRALIGYVATGVGLLGVLVSAIVLIHDPEPSETAAPATRKKPPVALAPILMPGGGGASLSLTW